MENNNSIEIYINNLEVERDELLDKLKIAYDRISELELQIQEVMTDKLGVQLDLSDANDEIAYLLEKLTWS